MDIESKLKALIAKRDMLFARLQQIYDDGQKIDVAANLKNFKIRYTGLENTKRDFECIIEKINELYASDKKKEYVPDFQSLESFDELYCAVTFIAGELAKREQAEQSSLGLTPTPAPVRSIPRLPQLPLLSFSGEDLSLFPVFKECFVNMIHDNSELTPADKVHYLIGSLSGKALSVASGIPALGINYNVIWEALCKKYDDKGLLASVYLDKILEMKPIQSQNSDSLNNFLAQFDSSVRALKKLDITDLADYICAYLALKKLDAETAKLFENSRRSATLPSYDEIIKFVDEQAKICARSSTSVKKGGSNSSKSYSAVNSNKQKLSHSFVSVKNNPQIKNISKCAICDGSHAIQYCAKFLEEEPTERYNIVKNKNLCLNCLGVHKIIKCKSKMSCRYCHLRHHSLLHFNNSSKHNGNRLTNYGQSENTTAPIVTKDSASGQNFNRGVALSNDMVQGDQNSSNINSLSLCSTGGNDVSRSFNSTVLLSTAVIDILDQTGQKHRVRAILDSASQRNIISVRCCKLLKLPISKSYSTIQTLGSSGTTAKGQVNLVVVSRINPSIRYPVTALVVDNIVQKMPLVEVDIGALAHIKQLPLADTEFHIPAPVDMILGSQIFPHLLGQRRVFGKSAGSPVAIETSLGFVIMGEAPTHGDLNINHSFCTLVDTPLEQIVEKFWELESFPSEFKADPDDSKCEEDYRNNYTRQSSGKYTVSLPFKYSASLLGDSYQVALRRLGTLEKKFRLDPLFKEQYCTVIKEYLNEGYMRKLVNTKIEMPCYFIPHHGVSKPHSTTPLRIVMDASAKTDSLFSLNDLLYSGPKLQNDVLALFLDFRLFQFGLTADIHRMYLKIGMCEEHTRFQRILWRFSEEETVSIYEMTSVIFGVKSSPYLALRTVRQLVEDEATSYPVAAKVAVQHMYMDDFLFSVSSVEHGKALYKQMVDLFKSGNWELAKWAVNSKSLLDIIPEKLRAKNVVSFEKDFLKVLGLQWNVNLDTFSFNLNIDSNRLCTKRNILSTVARFFDPLGLISPVTLKLKLFVSQLHLFKLGWDDVPPDDFVKKWKQFEKELPLLVNFTIPRHLYVFENSVAKLVGFADACQSSYGAVVYMRTNTLGKIRTNLICAKTKVARLNPPLTIPRLELLAAGLLAKLIDFIVKTLHSRICLQQIYALSDSTVALSWISCSPHRWKVFIANRVAKIQELVPADNWFHVHGNCNISDPLSRGLTPSSFLSNREWIFGPSWLQEDESQWPVRRIGEAEQTSLEQKVISFVVAENPDHPLTLLIDRCSSWLKLLRIMVYVLRFARLLPCRKFILASDLNAAENSLLKVVQKMHFSTEINLLKTTGECSPNFRKLRPFIQNDLLRVGGRLVNSELDYDSQHPILLPKKHHFVELLIKYYHSSHLHTGPNLVLSLLRQRYWILSGRGVVRNIISKCNVCFRARPKVQYPLMANLPSSRVTQCKAFLKTGVDYAGPLNLVLNRYRGTRSQKAYICLFVCLATKACHIELVSDLSTDNFIQAFKRFLARRGLVTELHSDQGSNFIGAKTVLKEMYQMLVSHEFEQKLTNVLASRGIEWKFNAPASPHMGGIWESNIKNIKTHLYKVIGNQLLTYEEMNTLLIQIEALLNSRPLSVLSSDPAEILPLTPAHFLTLTPLDRLPAAELEHENLNRLNRYQMIDQMVQHFWRRWSLEYLHTLQTRERWNTQVNPVKKDTIVLLQQPNTPPLQWPLGRIVEVFPGADGVIRVVSVKTKSGIYTRPVVKVCPLPTQ